MLLYKRSSPVIAKQLHTPKKKQKGKKGERNERLLWKSVYSSKMLIRRQRNLVLTVSRFSFILPLRLRLL